MPINLITGNPNKLRELQAIFPDSLELQSQSIDLDEIQSLDLHKIIHHKLLQAFDAVGEPVIVEDISAELDCLNGLPGPFIKYFEQKMGMGSLYKLSHEGAAVTIRCTMGYFDGETEHIVDGIMRGTITAPRGTEGFGFDFVFIPEGQTQTLSELGADFKNAMSHRFLAANQMVKYLAAA